MSGEVKVDYGELLPHELEERLKVRPVGYLPLGTLEWHGVQNALGADFIQARGLFRLAARRFGGVVMPPLWLGPDRITGLGDGTDYIGMDSATTTQPNQRLSGSMYWVPKGLFLMMVEAVLAQAKRVGFRCIVADGHGPSRGAWAEMADAWELQFGLKLVSAKRDLKGEWHTQMDHAGKNETSIMMAIRPDLVDLSRLPEDPDSWPLGVGGEDPRESDPEFGNSLIEETLVALGRKLDQLRV